MTAQIEDTCMYERHNYKILALSSKMLFKPQDYGMEPHMRTTSCWRGYWCEYIISDGELLLGNLYFHNSHGDYPPFNGVEVSPPEFKEVVSYCQNVEKPEMDTIPAHSGHRIYKEVNIQIPYTGKILLGDGFMREYMFNRGFQRRWAYEKLIELVFEKGVLLDCNDLSHIAKARREEMKNKGVSL